VYVTTLADSGTGSFRDAVSKSNRIIEFSVGGYVNLSSAVTLSSDITIDGSTAPGDGIGFAVSNMPPVYQMFCSLFGELQGIQAIVASNADRKTNAE
jgi:hypothetical protein